MDFENKKMEDVSEHQEMDDLTDEKKSSQFTLEDYIKALEGFGVIIGFDLKHLPEDVDDVHFYRRDDGGYIVNGGFSMYFKEGGSKIYEKPYSKVGTLFRHMLTFGLYPRMRDGLLAPEKEKEEYIEIITPTNWNSFFDDESQTLLGKAPPPMTSDTFDSDESSSDESSDESSGEDYALSDSGAE